MHFHNREDFVAMKKYGALIRNILFAIIVIAILVCQFIPFWRSGEPVADQASLIGMTGRQYKHENMIERMNNAIGFSYLDISTPVLLTVCFAALAAFCAINQSNAVFKGLVGLVPAIAGIYLWVKVPAYTLGMLGTVIFVLDIVLIISSILEIVMFFVNKPAKKD